MSVRKRSTLLGKVLVALKYIPHSHHACVFSPHYTGHCYIAQIKGGSV